MDGEPVHILVEVNWPAGERGAALLSAQISATLQDGGARADMAYIQARDIASLLADDKCPSAYPPLVTPDATQVEHQRAIDVHLMRGAVCFQMRTTCTDNEAPMQAPPG